MALTWLCGGAGLGLVALGAWLLGWEEGLRLAAIFVVAAWLGYLLPRAWSRTWRND